MITLLSILIILACPLLLTLTFWAATEAAIALREYNYIAKQQQLKLAHTEAVNRVLELATTNVAEHPGGPRQVTEDPKPSATMGSSATYARDRAREHSPKEEAKVQGHLRTIPSKPGNA